MKKLSDEVIEQIKDDAILVLHGETEEIHAATSMALEEAEAGKWEEAFKSLSIVENSLAKCLNVVQPWGNPPPEEVDYEQADRY
jgi:hypothetical protein